MEVKSAVLISIKPEWCNLISRGLKTVEVRKTRPKIKTPFKCYIYESKGKKIVKKTDIPEKCGGGYINVVEHEGSGKVIGEFICRQIIEAKRGFYCLIPFAQTCIDAENLLNYADGKPLFGWVISDLIIYDLPKDLNEFWEAGRCTYVSYEGCTYEYYCYRVGQAKRCGSYLTIPPQSWRYVAEMEG